MRHSEETGFQRPDRCQHAASNKLRLSVLFKDLIDRLRRPCQFVQDQPQVRFSIIQGQDDRVRARPDRDHLARRTLDDDALDDSLAQLLGRGGRTAERRRRHRRREAGVLPWRDAVNDDEPIAARDGEGSNGAESAGPLNRGLKSLLQARRASLHLESPLPRVARRVQPSIGWMANSHAASPFAWHFSSSHTTSGISAIRLIRPLRSPLKKWHTGVGAEGPCWPLSKLS